MFVKPQRRFYKNKSQTQKCRHRFNNVFLFFFPQPYRHYCDRRAATDEEKEVGFNAVVNIRFKIVKRIDEEALEEEEEEDYHDVSMDSGSTKERR